MSLAPVGPTFVEELKTKPDYVVVMFAKALGVELSPSPTKDEAILAMTGRVFTLDDVITAYVRINEIHIHAKEMRGRRK